jgi:hypothetical protein
MKLEYDAMSPITGTNTVLIEADETTNTESRLCTASGYTTKDTWKVGSDVIEQIEQRMPAIVVSKRYEDTELNQYWYLFTMSTPYGTIYPYGKDNNKWYWIVTPVVDVDAAEKEKYPVPGKPGEFYDSRLAIEHSQAFDSDKFEEALDSFYDLIQTTQLNNQEHAN